MYNVNWQKEVIANGQDTKGQKDRAGKAAQVPETRRQAQERAGEAPSSLDAELSETERVPAAARITGGTCYLHARAAGAIEKSVSV